MTPRSKIVPLDVVWRTCGASPECLGVAREPYGRCLAHLAPDEVAAVLRDLAPGQGLDLRGTVVPEDLLTRILGRLDRRVGRARFDRAVFPGQARFAEVLFTGDATFEHARFDRLASFYGARFARNASFRDARFSRELSMHGVRVDGHAAFDHMTVRGDALFGEARLGGDAAFPRAQFHGFAAFDAAVFEGHAGFRGARFHRTVSFRGADCAAAVSFAGARFHGPAYLGPMRAGRRLSLTAARACGPVHVDTGGCRVDLRGAALTGRLTARLSDADVDLRETRLAAPSAVTRRSGRLVVALDDLDAGALTITGADLRACGLRGLRRPEGLRLVDCLFAATPGGVGLRLGWPPVRWWTRRRVLADEGLWRGWPGDGRRPPKEARRTPDGGRETARGRETGPGREAGPGREPMHGRETARGPQDGSLDAARLAVLYERLRPGLDDPRTAADFAFGAMEMRRLGSPPGPARLLLSLSWATCGYGLRTGRALGWLTLVTALAAGAACWTAQAGQARQHAGHRPRVAVVRQTAASPRPAHLLTTRAG